MSALSPLLSFAGASVDRFALRVMARMFLSGGDPEAAREREDQERALLVYGDELLKRDRSVFYPQPPAPNVEVLGSKRVPGGRIERYRWPSGYKTWDPTFQAEYDAHEANRWAHAEALVHDRPGTPSIVCIHSWAAGPYVLQRWLFLAHHLFRDGLNVAICTLPFHGPRNPRGSWFGGQLFPGTTPRRTNEGFGQTIWDVRSLIGHMLARGSAAVGVVGMSIGGYSAALLAGIDSRIAFSVPMIPVVSLADLIWNHGEGHPKRREIEARGVTLERVRAMYDVHSPLAFPPLVPRDRRMIVGGTGDRVCTPEHVRLLWTHWEQPEIHWFPGSHIVHFGRPGVRNALSGFLRRIGWI
jgi:hypothetical protein